MASADDVKKLAALARIDIPENRLETFAAEFEGILSYVGKLDDLSLSRGSDRVVPVVRNVMRADGEPHEKGKYTKKIVEQFPDTDGNALSVKKIISYD